MGFLKQACGDQYFCYTGFNQYTVWGVISNDIPFLICTSVRGTEYSVGSTTIHGEMYDVKQFINGLTGIANHLAGPS
jgi:hypothetical protein